MLRILPILHNNRHLKCYYKKKDKLVEPTNLQQAVTFQIFRSTGHKSTFTSLLLQSPNHTHTHILSLSLSLALMEFSKIILKFKTGCKRRS